MAECLRLSLTCPPPPHPHTHTHATHARMYSNMHTHCHHTNHNHHPLFAPPTLQGEREHKSDHDVAALLQFQQSVESLGVDVVGGNFCAGIGMMAQALLGKVVYKFELGDGRGAKSGVCAWGEQLCYSDFTKLNTAAERTSLVHAMLMRGLYESKCEADSTWNCSATTFCRKAATTCELDTSRGLESNECARDVIVKFAAAMARSAAVDNAHPDLNRDLKVAAANAAAAANARDKADAAWAACGHGESCAGGEFDTLDRAGVLDATWRRLKAAAQARVATAQARADNAAATESTLGATATRRHNWRR